MGKRLVVITLLPLKIHFNLIRTIVFFCLVYGCTQKAAKETCRISNMSLYNSLDEFVSEHIHGLSSSLVLDNFTAVFTHYAIFCSLALAAFSAHHLIKQAKKRRIICKFSLSYVEIKSAFKWLLGRLFNPPNFRKVFRSKATVDVNSKI